MPNATFTHSGGSVTFTRCPARPDNSLDVVQPQRVTPGGVRHGYAHTITRRDIKLPLRMTTAQKDQLLTFFHTTVNAMAETFTYTDTSGVARTVRFATPRLDGIVEVAYDSWEVVVDLRLAP